MYAKLYVRSDITLRGNNISNILCDLKQKLFGLRFGLKILCAFQAPKVNGRSDVQKLFVKTPKNIREQACQCNGMDLNACLAHVN